MYCNSSVLTETASSTGEDDSFLQTSSKRIKLPHLKNQNKQKISLFNIYPKKSQDAPTVTVAPRKRAIMVQPLQAVSP